MSIIKYSVKFKRILILAVQQQGKMGQMRVGEVENFQQNPDGSLDIVAYIWPQVSDQMREKIEKNPSMLGMTAETLPVEAPLVFPNGTKFDEVEDPDAETMEKLRASIKKLEARLDKLCGGESQP